MLHSRYGSRYGYGISIFLKRNYTFFIFFTIYTRLFFNLVYPRYFIYYFLYLSIISVVICHNVTCHNHVHCVQSLCFYAPTTTDIFMNYVGPYYLKPCRQFRILDKYVKVVQKYSINYT